MKTIKGLMIGFAVYLTWRPREVVEMRRQRVLLLTLWMLSRIGKTRTNWSGKMRTRCPLIQVS